MKEIEIKFYNKENGEFLNLNDILNSSLYVKEFGNPFKDEKLIPLQFTGLKDKNGKEIYEGDICTVERKGWNEQWIFFEEIGMMPSIKVKNIFPDNSGKWRDTSLKNLEVVKNLKIIGNIYENPELKRRLKEKNENN